MSDPRLALMAQMAEAAMNAMLDACRIDGGESIIDPGLARQALVACLASILEVDPEIRTRRDMREISETVAKELRMQMQAVRGHFEATGERSGWDARVIPVH